MKKTIFLGALVLLTLHSVSNQALAQCGVTMSCGGEKGSVPGSCQIYACFKDSKAKRQYEDENNCNFPSGVVCNGKEIDEENQCCGRNAETGSNEIQEKQIKSLRDDFDWDVYRKRCPNMRQSEGAPDELWVQCIVGEKHSSKDYWPVVEVLPNLEHQKARSYCIDGCSTPPSIVAALYRSGVFIFMDKDNPIGNGDGGSGVGVSFYDSCKKHDICYQSCSSIDRKICDLVMLENMKDVCLRVPVDHITRYRNNIGVWVKTLTQDHCINAAEQMYVGLRAGGGSAFAIRKQQYCQCC